MKIVVLMESENDCKIVELEWDILYHRTDKNDREALPSVLITADAEKASEALREGGVSRLLASAAGIPDGRSSDEAVTFFFSQARQKNPDLQVICIGADIEGCDAWIARGVHPRTIGTIVTSRVLRACPVADLAEYYTGRVFLRAPQQARA